jgi:hypothetical protein
MRRSEVKTKIVEALKTRNRDVALQYAKGHVGLTALCESMAEVALAEAESAGMKPPQIAWKKAFINGLHIYPVHKWEPENDESER